MTDDWIDRPTHRAWLASQTLGLLRFYRPMLQSDGCFVALDDDGRLLSAVTSVTGVRRSTAGRQELLTVARAVHCYALGDLLGVPGSAPVVRRGLETLWEDHRDAVSGGYASVVDAAGPVDVTRRAYDHAFVLLAAASALEAGHDGAAELLDDVIGIIDVHFWDEGIGAAREAFDGDWHEIEPYRGANSNMHLCESLLAAADATGRPDLARRADRILRLVIDGHARAAGWLVPEHYDTDWQPLPHYNEDRPGDPFRPPGATIGHGLEWARLTMTVRLAVGGDDDGWYREAAEGLFDRAVAVGWDDVHGGLAYTVGPDGRPGDDDHYWWPVAEGIAAAACLQRTVGRRDHERWYRRFWDFAARVLIDDARGGWYPQFDARNHRKATTWAGKPDLYHALQATLLPVVPLGPGLAGAIRRDRSSAERSGP